ncbi:hypothetical protein A2U01_0092708, partial [Trifolium medium]|nr:hypothetical protein [Trifolium medium]
VLLTLAPAMAGVVLDVAPMLCHFFSDRTILLITVNCLRTAMPSFRNMLVLFGHWFRTQIATKKRFSYK